MLIASGGVDTWKMDIHPWWWASPKTPGCRHGVRPSGYGRRDVPLDDHADEFIVGIADYARRIGDGRVAHFGVSFGGNFSAMSGLTGIVDAAVDLGGPVEAAFGAENLAKLPYGMHDILGNAMWAATNPELASVRACAAVCLHGR